MVSDGAVAVNHHLLGLRRWEILAFLTTEGCINISVSSVMVGMVQAGSPVILAGRGRLSAGAVESTPDASWTQIHAFEKNPIWFGSDSKYCTAPATNPTSPRILISELRHHFLSLTLVKVPNLFYPVNAMHFHSSD